MTKKTGIRATAWQIMLMGLRYLGGRKLRTVLTTLSIVFGVALIFAVNLTIPAATEAFEQGLSTASGADIRIVNTTGGPFAPEDVLPTIADVPGVRAATGNLERTFVMPDIEETNPLANITQINLVGVDPDHVQNVRQFTMGEGRFLETGDEGAVVIPSTLTELAPALQVGTSFPLITAQGVKTFTVVGLIDEQASLALPQMFMTLEDAQAMVNQPGLINTVEVNIDVDADLATVTAAVQNALGSQFQLDEATNATDSVGTFQIAFSVLNLLGFLALFLGAFLIFNTFRTVVVERQHDLAMLRAIGATRRQITMMILIEGLIQGVVGTVIGLIIGYLLAVLYVGVMFNQVLSNFIAGVDIQLHIIPSAVVLAVVLGVATTLIAGYLPARSASRISPLEALRPTTCGMIPYSIPS